MGPVAGWGCVATLAAHADVPALAQLAARTWEPLGRRGGGGADVRGLPERIARGGGDGAGWRHPHRRGDHQQPGGLPEPSGAGAGGVGQDGTSAEGARGGGGGSRGHPCHGADPRGEC